MAPSGRWLLPSGRPEGGPTVIGAHVEGPFISERRLGVHPPAARRSPDRALLERLLDSGDVNQVTLAPELPGALELIDVLTDRGVVVSEWRVFNQRDELVMTMRGMGLFLRRAA